MKCTFSVTVHHEGPPISVINLHKSLIFSTDFQRNWEIYCTVSPEILSQLYCTYRFCNRSKSDLFCPHRLCLPRQDHYSDLAVARRRKAPHDEREMVARKWLSRRGKQRGKCTGSAKHRGYLHRAGCRLGPFCFCCCGWSSIQVQTECTNGEGKCTCLQGTYSGLLSFLR